MEIKRIYSCNIEVVGKKAVCSLILTDADKYRNAKKVQVAISNIYALMTLFDVENIFQLIGIEVKCLIHEKFKEITFISPLVFKEEVVQSDFVRCNQVYLNEP